MTNSPPPARTVSETCYKGYDIRTDETGRVWIYHQSHIVAGPVTGSHAKSLVDDYTGAIGARENSSGNYTHPGNGTPAMNVEQDRVANLNAKIAGLYAEVDRLDGQRRFFKGHDSTRAYALDIQSQTLREQARALDRELDTLRRAKPKLTLVRP